MSPIIAVYVSRRPEAFSPTLKSLAAVQGAEVVIGARDPRLLAGLRGATRTLESDSPSAFINQLWQETGDDIVGIWDAILAPPDFLSTACQAMEQDARVATVSFLSNSAGFLSFPHPNHPALRPPEGHDETSVSAALRSKRPRPRTVPIPLSAGPAVLISSGAIGTLGMLQEDGASSTYGALADFCMRASTKGFVHLADMGTFYARPSDLTIEDPDDHMRMHLPASDLEWLQSKHRFADMVLAEADIARRPMCFEYQCARSKILGLSVHLDGSCLGPQEMGSQVTTLALIRALAEQKEIREVLVSLTTDPPSYAVDVLSHPKVRPRHASGGDLTDFPHADIGHRPFQPDQSFDVTSWRSCCGRVITSLLDLIAFRTAAYHSSRESWWSYKESFVQALAKADAVVGIAEDVREQAKLERLPIDGERMFVVPPGTDHLAGEESARPPEELVDMQLVAKDFLLILGANYAHKNRDVALTAAAQLLDKGWDLQVILVGASVPFGSSRVEEAGIEIEPGRCLSLPDVQYEERNWLLKHASVVLYPTSAEGFGYVPHEAARFGTPTVFVGFGPLKEVMPSLPVTARDWRPSSFAEAVEKLLRDPDLARKQVAGTLESAAHYNWSSTAEKLIEVYRTVLARPPAS